MSSKFNSSRNSNNNKTNSTIRSYTKKMNLNDGIVYREVTSFGTSRNYSRNISLNTTIDLNYGFVLKFLFIFALVVLMSSFVLNDGFDKVFIDNSFNESISVVDGYSYNINYTFYDWTTKFSVLQKLKNIFEISDILELYESLNLYFNGESLGPNLFGILYIIVAVPIKVLTNIIYDIYIILRFIVTW